MKAHDFLISLKSHAEVAPRFANGKRACERARYRKLAGGGKNLAVRSLCKKAFDEEFFFVRAGDAIIVPSKDNMKSERSEDEVKKLRDSCLLEPENESLKDFLNRCTPCCVITRCEE